MTRVGAGGRPHKSRARGEALPALDGLRGLCAVAVVVAHCALVTGANETGGLERVVGRMGVAITLFFVISGFLLYRPFLLVQRHEDERTLTARTFWVNRIVRVVPAYWVALTICLVVPPLREAYTTVDAVKLGDAWRYYLFLQTYDAATVGLGFAHAWTLCADMAFYAALPAYAACAARLTRRRHAVRDHLVVLLVIGLASTAIRMTAYASGSATIHVTLAGLMLWVAVGMAFAVVAVQAPGCALMRSGRRHPVLWLGAAASLYLGLGATGLPTSINGDYTTLSWGAEHMSYALLAGMLMLPIVAAGNQPGRALRLLGSAPMTWLGSISYGLYLWHLPVIFCLVALRVPARFPHSPFLALTVLAVTAAAGCGALSNRLIDRPLRRALARRRAVRPLPRSLPAAAPAGTLVGSPQ